MPESLGSTLLPGSCLNELAAQWMKSAAGLDSLSWGLKPHPEQIAHLLKASSFNATVELLISQKLVSAAEGTGSSASYPMHCFILPNVPLQPRSFCHDRAPRSQAGKQ